MGYYKFFLEGGFALNGYVEMALSDLRKVLKEKDPDDPFMGIRNACAIQIAPNPEDPNKGLAAVKPIGPVDEEFPIRKSAVVGYHALEEATSELVEKDFVSRRSNIIVPKAGIPPAVKARIQEKIKQRRDQR